MSPQSHTLGHNLKAKTEPPQPGLWARLLTLRHQQPPAQRARQSARGPARRVSRNLVVPSCPPQLQLGSARRLLHHHCPPRPQRGPRRGRHEGAQLPPTPCGGLTGRNIAQKDRGNSLNRYSSFYKKIFDSIDKEAGVLYSEGLRALRSFVACTRTAGRQGCSASVRLPWPGRPVHLRGGFNQGT